MEMIGDINSSVITTTPRLEMHGVSKRFGATIALQQVDFSLLPGEVHALVGENGAGKSTLMKILSAVHKADQGFMLLDGKPFQPSDPLQARHQGIGMIYQELSLVPHLTVEENIMLGIEPTTLGFIQWKEVRERTLEAIKNFNHPEISPKLRVANLSQSAQQLVEIGRSLALGSRVLVFDEPTSSLSRQDTTRLFDLIRSFKQQGISIVYISHFIEEVEHVADRITVLRDGVVVGTKAVMEITEKEVVQMMVGREVKELYPRSIRKQGEVLLEVHNLQGVSQPQSASVKLYRGEVLGIFGLVGAGRTQFIRAIFGLDPIRKGKIRIGKYSGFKSPVERWKQGVGLLSENRKDEGLAVTMSISDNVTLSKLNDLGPLGLIFYRRQNEVTQKWIELLGIKCREPGQMVKDLSGGNQQKIALARLLYHDVDIALLDEPTKGIDVAAKAKMYKVINDLASPTGENAKQSKAILMISSYLPELLGICDRIAVMYRGVLGPARPVEEIDENTVMLAATGKEEKIIDR
jgi:ribose transport system ATP-binding protein